MSLAFVVCVHEARSLAVADEWMNGHELVALEPPEIVAWWPKVLWA